MSDRPIAALILFVWILVGMVIGRCAEALGDRWWVVCLVAVWLGLGIVAGMMIAEILADPR